MAKVHGGGWGIAVGIIADNFERKHFFAVELLLSAGRTEKRQKNFIKILIRLIQVLFSQINTVFHTGSIFKEFRNMVKITQQISRRKRKVHCRRIQ